MEDHNQEKKGVGSVEWVFFGGAGYQTGGSFTNSPLSMGAVRRSIKNENTICRTPSPMRGEALIPEHFNLVPDCFEYLEMRIGLGSAY